MIVFIPADLTREVQDDTAERGDHPKSLNEDLLRELAGKSRLREVYEAIRGEVHQEDHTIADGRRLS